MMNRPYNSTCSLCFNLPLCHLPEPSSSDPGDPSCGETRGAEQSCSSPSLEGTAVGGCAQLNTPMGTLPMCLTSGTGP